MARPPIACSWLRELAEGYLRKYTNIVSERSGGLWGYRFQPSRPSRHRFGVFVGFLTRPAPRGVRRLRVVGRQECLPHRLYLEPPECAVFAFVPAVGSRLHGRLEWGKGSLLRRSYDLITKYTPRRPQWEFHQDQEAALLRHVPLAAFPAGEEEKYARNFFIETLAVLVRSSLPEALRRLRFAGGKRSAGGSESI